MSHMHVPDGVIAPIWWILGYVLTFGIIFMVLRRVEGDAIRKKIPMIGIVTAIMLIGMSVPLGVIPAHLSLAMLAGILIGPALAFISVFVVNLLLALVAHGGITLVGLNTLIIGAEVLVGYNIFKALRKRFGQMPSTVIATSLALMVSMGLMVTSVGFLAGFREALPDFHIKSVEGADSIVAGAKYIFFTGWWAVIMVFVVGNLLESFGTGYIVRYFMKVRPDLVFEESKVIEGEIREDGIKL